ncbi:MAG: PEP-CTERM sorting domain-containing protein [Proteobacteria bacterium]|nr:PEP-CTERM sorting domain-containing protein [Pseudomonadota bacterium]
MKKISISLMGLALLAILLIAPAAQAAMSANIIYSETNLGCDWKYDFTVENTSLMTDSHPYLWNVALTFENSVNVTLLNTPADWTVATYTYSPLYLNEPIETDYLEMSSDSIAFDVLPGALLAISFTADCQLGEITYVAEFSDHGEFEDWSSISGTAAPVPVPSAVLLLGFGLIGLAGICRKTDR